MIIREGINVKYTHDEEALLASWSEMREFAGVSPRRMIGWIAREQDFGWSASYWHVPDTDFFRSTFTFWYGQRQTPDAIKVELWRAEEFTRHIFEKHGFACVACGAWTRFEARGKLYWTLAHHRAVEASVRRRMSIGSGPLICRECAIDLPMVLIMDGRRSAKAIDRLLERVIPFAEARP
jgi:hypothetical protein